MSAIILDSLVRGDCMEAVDCCHVALLCAYARLLPGP